MTPTIPVIMPDGKHSAITKIVADHLGIRPGQPLDVSHLDRIKRSLDTHVRAHSIMTHAMALVNPEPGKVVFAGDPGCELCHGQAFKANAFTGRVEACQYCIAHTAGATRSGPTSRGCEMATRRQPTVIASMPIGDDEVIAAIRARVAARQREKAAAQ